MSQSKSYAIRLTVSAVLEAGLETTPLASTISRRLPCDLLSRLSNQISPASPKSYMFNWRRNWRGQGEVFSVSTSYPCGLEIRVFSPHRHCDDFVMIHYFEAFSRCIIARLLFLHSSSLSWLHHSPVQTESCNYPDCHLIAAPLSAASPRTSPFYITQIQRERERERAGRNDSILSWNQLKLHNVSHPSYYLITMPGFLHTLLLFLQKQMWCLTQNRKPFSLLHIQNVLYGFSLLTVESGEFFGVIRLFPKT